MTNYLRNAFAETPKVQPQPIAEPLKGINSFSDKFSGESIVSMNELLEVKGGRGNLLQFFDMKNSCGCVMPQ